jgi:hypothetical protein
VKASGSALRVGFIGAGFSARPHADVYRQVRGVDVALTRVAAARRERAARSAEEFGVSAVAASAEEVLAAPDVNVVDLCVPTSRESVHPGEREGDRGGMLCVPAEGGRRLGRDLRQPPHRALSPSAGDSGSGPPLDGWEDAQTGRTVPLSGTRRPVWLA